MNFKVEGVQPFTLKIHTSISLHILKNVSKYVII